eukprot:3724418-Rhodomonas_salina.1
MSALQHLRRIPVLVAGCTGVSDSVGVWLYLKRWKLVWRSLPGSAHSPRHTCPPSHSAPPTSAAHASGWRGGDEDLDGEAERERGRAQPHPLPAPPESDSPTWPRRARKGRGGVAQGRAWLVGALALRRHHHQRLRQAPAHRPVPCHAPLKSKHSSVLHRDVSAGIGVQEGEACGGRVAAVGEVACAPPLRLVVLRQQPGALGDAEGPAAGEAGLALALCSGDAHACAARCSVPPHPHRTAHLHRLRPLDQQRASAADSRVVLQRRVD